MTYGASGVRVDQAICVVDNARGGRECVLALRPGGAAMRGAFDVEAREVSEAGETDLAELNIQAPHAST